MRITLDDCFYILHTLIFLSMYFIKALILIVVNQDYSDL